MFLGFSHPHLIFIVILLTLGGYSLLVGVIFVSDCASYESSLNHKKELHLLMFLMTQ